MITDHAGQRVLSHGGSTVGQVAYLWVCPDRDLAVAVCANSLASGGAFTDRVEQWRWTELLQVDPPRLLEPTGGLAGPGARRWAGPATGVPAP